MEHKTIGIIGGMGPYATIAMFERIVSLTPAAKDWEHLHIVVDNHPQIPSRTRCVLLGEASPLPMMIESANRLQAAGCHFVLLPCASAHYWWEGLSGAVGIPVLNIIRTTLRAAAQRGNIRKVGTMAGWVPWKTGLFEKEGLKMGLEVVLPGEEGQQQVVDLIEAVKLGAPEGKPRDRALVLANRMIADGCDGIILGCTELPMAIAQADLPVPVFDLVDIYARAAILDAWDGG